MMKACQGFSMKALAKEVEKQMIKGEEELKQNKVQKDGRKSGKKDFLPSLKKGMQMVDQSFMKRGVRFSKMV